MRYIVSKDTLNNNVRLAQQMVGQHRLSLIFKEYYEQLASLLVVPPTGEIFSVGIKNSVCYALGLATKRNKAALVNTIGDVHRLRYSGICQFYIPIDTGDEREGLPLKEASCLADTIRKEYGYGVSIKGMVTNGCINDSHPKSRKEWDSVWRAIHQNVESLSVGGSFWLDKSEQLPDYVSDVRIGRFMLFGYIPYSSERPAKPCLKLESVVLGINKNAGKIMLDMGDAYCDPLQCIPCEEGLSLMDTSSNYAVFRTDDTSKYEIGQKLLFIPEYRHSAALARINVKFDNE